MSDINNLFENLTINDDVIKLNAIKIIQNKYRENKNSILVGVIEMSDKKYSGTKYVMYQTPLKITFDDNFPQQLQNKFLSIVYLFKVDGKIYKIGQTSGKGGIRSCLGFYLNAGLDDPGQNRFAINFLIRQEIEQNKKIEVFMIYEEPIKSIVKGLYGKYESYVVPSAKQLEENCIKDYKNLYGKFPRWNFQERSVTYPSEIHKAFALYKIKRSH